MHFSGTGTLTRDPDVYTTKNGKTIVTFSVAVNNGKDSTGAEKPPFFFDCKAVGFEADRAKLLRKASRVVMSGELQQETWDDKATGAKRSKVVLLAWSIGVQADTRNAAPPVYDSPAAKPATDSNGEDSLPF